MIRALRATCCWLTISSTYVDLHLEAGQPAPLAHAAMSYFGPGPGKI